MCGVFGGYKIVSSNFVMVLNRLVTAMMLVGLLVVCQDMPESDSFGKSFGKIDLEHLASRFDR